jgi:dihydrofolate synthase/folylpolyglutamate synthase
MPTDKTDRPLNWLEENIGFEVFKSSLDILKTFLEKNHLLEIIPSKVISVVGTNGKGQVVRELSTQLKKNGKKVLRFTSPHQFRLGERFNFDSNDIEDQELLRIFHETKKLIDKDEVHLSFFEFLYASFLIWVKEHEDFDFVIFEAGLGGRLDATKCLKANSVILTSIGRDHTNILGTSLKQILLEKLGILYPNSQLIYHLSSQFLENILEDFTVTNQVKSFKVPLPLDCNYFEQNQELVKFLIQDLFKLKYFNLGTSPLVKLNIFDKILYYNSAHNLPGMRKIFQFLEGNSYTRTEKSNKKWDLILLAFSDRSESELKQIKKLVEAYPCIYNKIKVIIFDHPRALSFSQAQKIFTGFGIEKLDNLDLSRDEKILLLGSNYCMGQFNQASKIE